MNRFPSIARVLFAPWVPLAPAADAQRLSVVLAPKRHGKTWAVGLIRSLLAASMAGARR